MQPFKSVLDVQEWYRTNALGREVGVLLDYTDIKRGIQRREIQRWGQKFGLNGSYVLTFPSSQVVTAIKSK